jgi:hypothetical protein
VRNEGNTIKKKKNIENDKKENTQATTEKKEYKKQIPKKQTDEDKSSVSPNTHRAFDGSRKKNTHTEP